MKKNIKNILIYTVLLILGISCNSEVTNPEGGGTLKLYLTDASNDYDAVNITFSEISVHLVPDWITVVGEEFSVNLLDYSNGESLLLSNELLSSGKYTQIRLHITDANVVVNGETHPMTVPSEKLKLGPQFTIEDGITYEMVIDFDAERSVLVSGPEDEPSYKLKPHIRVVQKAITGSISGVVTNNENNPTAYAKQNDEVITSSIVKEEGTFVLAFLEEGEYEVLVQDTEGKKYSNASVLVVVGDDNDLGEITLE